MTKNRCIKPDSLERKDVQTLEKMLSSHVWNIDSVENKTTGIFIKYTCVDCSTDRFAFVEYLPKTLTKSK